MMKALFCLSLLLVLLTCCVEKNEASKIHFQTFDMSHHLFSASICNRASTAGFKNRLPTTVLEVAHRHSPCVQTDKNRPVDLPSVTKILANDQLRVKYIQSRAVKTVDSINTNKDLNKSSRERRAQLPAQSGELLMNTGDYFVTIDLGTPERNLSFSFDTGSGLSWTQCQPCRHCYRQKDPFFNPSASTTYSNISCKSKDCPHTFGCYHNITCVYGVGYDDKSYTFGFLSKDKLTVSPTDLFQGFLFGCGQNNTGTFGLTDGLLGLDRGPRSFVSQTAEKYHGHFSYCLPSTINLTGFLSFGKNNKSTKRDDDDDDAMIFTYFVPPPLDFPPIFYFIEITAISVGGTQLKINGSIFKKTGTIIDSGTTFTYLPHAAYNAMSKEFKKQMNKYYKSAPTYEDLDTCFHIPKHTTMVKVPPVSFTFLGNATIYLDASGILYAIKPTYACLAFAGNSDPDNLAIFGNTQQKKFEVAYDVAGNKLGFAPNPPGCQ